MMGKCIMSGIVPQLTVPFKAPANFADATWAQIIEACQKKRVPDTWLVADQKTMTIGGTDYAIDIIGKNHDTYSDDSGMAPLTFQMHDCYADVMRMNASNTNYGGWELSEMRTSNILAILDLMPVDVKSNIQTVNKLTAEGGNSSTIVTTADKLFLLSEVEIFGVNKYSANGEGTQYDYYKAGNSKIKGINGGQLNWSERSPFVSKAKNFCSVTYDGNWDYSMPADTLLGVSFGFCF